MKTIRDCELLVEARGIEINGRSASFRDMFKWARMESESNTDHSSFPVRVLLPCVLRRENVHLAGHDLPSRLSRARVFPDLCRCHVCTGRIILD